MMFAAAVGHRSGRATPSLRGAPQRQSMEIVRRETIYRNRNAVQTNPATSVLTTANIGGVSDHFNQRHRRAASTHTLSDLYRHFMRSGCAMRLHIWRDHMRGRS